MENGAKALIIAGAVLLATMVSSFAVLIYNKVPRNEQSIEGLTSLEIANFNSRWERYEGEGVLGPNVKALMSYAISNAKEYENEILKIPTFEIDSNEYEAKENNNNAYIQNIQEQRKSIKENCTYNVNLEYSAYGLLKKVKITEVSSSKPNIADATCLNGHTFGEWDIIAATCLEKGVMTRHCKYCDEVETREIQPLGHDMSGKEVIKVVTCISEGEEKIICKRCGYFEDKIIPALGHNMGAYERIKSPTCTEDGEEKSECSRCDYAKSKNLAALGHNMGDYERIKSPTCTEDGEEKSECSRCDYAESKNLAALGHNMGDYERTKEPTCTEEGEEKSECSRCSHTESKNLEALGHNMGDYKRTKEPTCTKKGEEKSECSRCSHTESKNLEALGHNMGDYERTKEPTCTEKGEKKSECSRCGSKDTIEIAALGHDMGTWYTSIEPTCTREGEKKRCCKRSNCRNYESDSISSMGHNWGTCNGYYADGSPAWESTTTSIGSSECSNCNKTTTHKRTDVICNKCGITNSSTKCSGCSYEKWESKYGNNKHSVYKFCLNCSASVEPWN